MLMKLKKFNLFLVIAVLIVVTAGAVRAETLTDDQIKMAIQQDRERLFKKYNITVAKSGEYPVTIFDNDKVPLPDANLIDPFKWVDNDTLIYQKNEKSIFDSIVTVNLKTFELKKVADDGAGLCYDTETHRIEYSARSPNGGHSLIKYGVLGQPLKTQEYSDDDFKSGLYPYYVNSFDCTFYTPRPDLGKAERLLRVEDGSVKGELKDPATNIETPGVYIFTKKDGTEKKLEFGAAPSRILHYDYFSHLYWITHITPDHKLAVMRLDKNFDIVKEEMYPSGTEYGIFSVRRGFISAFVSPARNMDGKLIRGKAGEIYNSMGGMVLVTQTPGLLEILEGDVSKISVSPNGCRAVFLYTQNINKPSPGQVGVIDLCKNFYEGEK
jgi:hypothetical protein